MDEHVPAALLQGAAQSGAVQLASYREREIVCLPVTCRLNTLEELMNDADFYYAAAFDMHVCGR